VNYVHVVALLAATWFSLACAVPAAAQTPPPAGTATDARDAVRSTQEAQDALRDVPAGSWEYQAVQRLTADGIISGYPDKTFKGDRPLTRYEMAVIADRAVHALEAEMALGKPVAKDDLDAVRRLLAEYAHEVEGVQQQVAVLEQRVDTTAKTVTAQGRQLRSARIGINAWIRPGSYTETLSAINGPTSRVAGQAPNRTLTSGNVTFSPGHGNTSSTTLSTKPVDHGALWQDMRLAVSGDVDRHIGYQFRIEQAMYGEQPSGQTTTNPAFCINSACTPIAGTQDFPSNLPVRLNVAELTYRSGPLFVKAGRFTLNSGRWNESGLVYGGVQDNGVQVGYRDRRFDAWVMQEYGASSATNAVLFPTNATTCPLGLPSNCINQNSTGLLFKGEYYEPKLALSIGGTYNAMSGVVNSEWNPRAGLCAAGAAAAVTTLDARTVPCPSGTTRINVTNPLPGQVMGAPVTGAYQTVQTNIPAASIFLVKPFGDRLRPQFKIVTEAEMRLGKDPLTGASWADNRAFHGEIAFASKGNIQNGPILPAGGVRNSNVAQFDYFNIGLNGTGAQGGPYGTAAYNSFYFLNNNGLQSTLLLFGHWFSDEFRLTAGVERWNVRKGTTIPAGSLTCPGCYVGNMNANAVFLDSWIYF
jgi:S-layer homology domain